MLRPNSVHHFCSKTFLFFSKWSTLRNLQIEISLYEKIEHTYGQSRCNIPLSMFDTFLRKRGVDSYNLAYFSVIVEKALDKWKELSTFFRPILVASTMFKIIGHNLYKWSEKWGKSMIFCLLLRDNIVGTSHLLYRYKHVTYYIVPFTKISVFTVLH